MQYVTITTQDGQTKNAAISDSPNDDYTIKTYKQPNWMEKSKPYILYSFILFGALASGFVVVNYISKHLTK